MKPIEFEAGTFRLVVRDIEERDLPALVDYWHESPDDYLVSLGVDLARRGSREQTRARFAAGMGGGPGRDAMTVVGTVEEEVVLYAHAHVIEPGIAIGHYHALRQKPAILAAAFKLFQPVCNEMIDALELERLRFNAATENRGINRFLETFGLEPERVYIERPDGLGRAGEFNVYEIRAGAVPAR